MKSLIPYSSLLSLFFVISCSQKPSKAAIVTREKTIQVLPFKTISLDGLTGFNTGGKNWKIAGNAYVDRSQENVIIASSGTGVLVNLPENEMNEHLFTTFEHGDIEVEVDVMMPVNSNSGLYFQGRYEIQLFDSWRVKEPQHSDIGGIYQRWDTSKKTEEKGYEGHPPRINAGKAPGLWQHFKIIFHAPRFNASGVKVKNASFEEVWLNGELLHRNVEVTGPTRSAAFGDEKAKAPFMIQGDHGPVAIKNIKYKLYGDRKVSFKDVLMKEYKNKEKSIPNLK